MTRPQTSSTMRIEAHDRWLWMQFVHFIHYGGYFYFYERTLIFGAILLIMEFRTWVDRLNQIYDIQLKTLHDFSSEQTSQPWTIAVWLIKLPPGFCEMISFGWNNSGFLVDSRDLNVFFLGIASLAMDQSPWGRWSNPEGYWLKLLPALILMQIPCWTKHEVYAEFIRCAIRVHWSDRWAYSVCWNQLGL